MPVDAGVYQSADAGWISCCWACQRWAAGRSGRRPGNPALFCGGWRSAHLSVCWPAGACFDQAAFPIAIGLSGLALFGLGAAKVLVTERTAWKSGLEMLVVGGLAAGVAYLVGALLKGIGG